jgi:hypothetical protein
LRFLWIFRGGTKGQIDYSGKTGRRLRRMLLNVWVPIKDLPPLPPPQGMGKVKSLVIFYEDHSVLRFVLRTVGGLLSG